MINYSDYRLIPHLGRIEGQGDELPARAPLVGVTLQLVVLRCVVRDLITITKIFHFSGKYLLLTLLVTWTRLPPYSNSL